MRIAVSISTTQPGSSAGATPTGVPVEITPPYITGTATVGQTLTGQHGAYTNFPSSFTQRWLKNGSAISGANGITYVPVSGDAGATITFEETPSNVAYGAGSASTSTGVTPVAAPAITGTPATTGTEGGSYSATFSKSGGRGTGGWQLTGSIVGSGLAFSSSTGAVTATTLGTPGTYGPLSVQWVDDDGIASNAISWSVTISAASGSVAPSNTTPASIDNVTDIGQTGTATPGVWTGSPTPTVTGVWRRDGTPISGATNLTYARTFEDAGAVLDYYETADNGVGSPVNQASNSVTVFHPSSLSAKAVAFFDAADVANITQSGGAVSSWSSRLGNANPHTNGVGAQRPIWDAASYNGRPGVTGDGVDDNLDSTTVSGWPITNAFCEEWAGVYQPTPASSTGSKCISQYGNNAASTTRARSLERIVISGVNRFRAANGNNSGAFDSTNTSVDFSGYHIVRSIWDGTNLNAEIDGTAGPNTAGTPAILQARSRLFCSSLTTPNAHSAVTLGWKMIFSSALTTGEATSLRRWANAGAGITPNP